MEVEVEVEVEMEMEIPGIGQLELQRQQHPSSAGRRKEGPAHISRGLVQLSSFQSESGPVRSLCSF
jgi:hypothetical protein